MVEGFITVKKVVEEMFQISNFNMIIPCNDDAILINNHINVLLGRSMMVENKAIYCIVIHAKLLNHGTK